MAHPCGALHDSELDPLGSEIDAQNVLSISKHRRAARPDEEGGKKSHRRAKCLCGDGRNIRITFF